MLAVIRVLIDLLTRNKMWISSAQNFIMSNQNIDWFSIIFRNAILYYYYMINDDPRLSALITKGDEADFVIVGYPYEHASKRLRRKGGQQNGPCCLRRFYAKVGPLYNSEYDIDISRIKISDYGNIDSKDKPELALQSKVAKLLANNQVPIVIGGTKQTTVATSLAFLQRYPTGKILLICGNPAINRLDDNNKLTSLSSNRLLSELIGKHLILVGTQQKYWLNNEVIQFGQRIDMCQIRNTKIDLNEDIMSPRTQLGTCLKSILKEAEAVHISISLEAIDRNMGTELITFGGISVQEILESMLQCGIQGNIKSMDITEFNPSVEDYNTSLLVLNLVYYLLMGIV